MVSQFQAWVFAGHAPENEPRRKGGKLAGGQYEFEGLLLATYPITDWNSKAANERAAALRGTTSLYWREVARAAFDAELPAPGTHRDRALALMRRLASEAIEHLREFAPDDAGVFVGAERYPRDALGGLERSCIHELLRSLPKVQEPPARHTAQPRPKPARLLTQHRQQTFAEAKAITQAAAAGPSRVGWVAMSMER